MMLGISIVVISYQSAKFLENNLDSLFSQTLPFNQVIIVDNDSTDNSLEIIERYEKKHPFVLKKIALDYNSGYAAAANLGIRETGSELVLVANSDIILEKNFNEEVVQRFSNDDDVAMLSPLLLRFDRETVDSAGQTFSRALYPLEIGFNRPLSSVPEASQERLVFSVCGAATVFRRSTLRQLEMDGQYYDEDFFIFWEDFDIGWRAHRLGLKKIFLPSARVYHYRSATLKRNFFSRFSLSLGRSGFIKYHLIKNRYLTLIKNFRFKEMYRTIPFIFLKDMIWVGLLTLSSPAVIIRLIRSGKAIRKALEKRKKMKRTECNE